ncbi:hypothetical protein ACTI_06760 [Actinoplanes sp. OR16]|uniref:hypothetical protein n=1 Tax=Actinoplanes sp. OR16 TaxID=946334 RepID=UPI000F71C2F4|nr:hypothetical protein [Actinoplanes sp. OR16]BBH63991.1 hypothetical protein ACTI_06760 [Actinoplanes sp. OR16]
MTAPGDLVILAVLLSLFVACCGYAAGRIHQRRQHGADRAEAYRSGYATGTRSVFSMAARQAGRRRERVSARVAIPRPVSPRPSTPEPADAVAETGSPSHGADPVPQGGFPAPAPHAGPGIPEPAAPGGVTYSSLPDPQWAPQPHVPEQRAGKHTVPEELVRAATYRLAPDRVARAKVVKPDE